MNNFREFEQFGKYTLIKKIAIGGMAEVFLVKTEKTAGVSQFVVLKRILPQFSSNKKFRVMFKNEGKIASHLKHSNLVYHHEFGVHKGVYYIVMEYVAGISLKDFMKRVLKTGKKIPIPIIVTVMRSVASALHYINNSIDPETGQPLNLVHRDVTPHNIMISFNGDIKLIDFGVAKVDGVDLTSAGIVKGKFSYMSPEQISGKNLSNRSDIFSLGVVFWELLTGKKLFDGDNIQSIFQKIKSGKIPSVSKYRPEVHSELSAIVSQMLRKNINSRFAGAEDVERKLSLFLNKQHTNFSHLDFNGFLKKIYSNEIDQERKFIVRVNKKLLEESQQATSVTHYNGSSIKPVPEDGVGISKMKTSTDSEEKRKEDSPAKTNPFKVDPTVISPRAPLGYSRTHIFQKNLDDTSITVQSTDDEDDQAHKSVGSTFDDLVESYRDKKQSFSKRIKTRALALLALIGVGLIVLSQYSTEELMNQLSSLKPSPAVESELDEVNSLSTLEEDLEEDSENSEREIASDYFRIYIDTHPSGAFVRLNGQKINKTTPLFVNVPNHPNNVLEVERFGYETYQVDDLRPNSEIKVRLKKLSK